MCRAMLRRARDKSAEVAECLRRFRYAPRLPLHLGGDGEDRGRHGREDDWG